MSIESDYMEVDTGYPIKGEGAGKAIKSIEGWVVFVTNINEEATEEDIEEFFGEFGEIMDITLNLDRRTGYVKGYALVEFNKLEDAQAAVNASGEELLGKKLTIDFAFVQLPTAIKTRRRPRAPEGSRSPSSERDMSDG